MINYIRCKVWDEITYPFPNFNGFTVEVWEWISIFIPHFTRHVITYHRVIKRGSVCYFYNDTEPPANKKPPDSRSISHFLMGISIFVNRYLYIAKTKGLLFIYWQIMWRSGPIREDVAWSMKHYNDVIMTMMASQITSLTVFYWIVYSNVYSKAPRHWPLCREFNGDWWIPHTKSQ